MSLSADGRFLECNGPEDGSAVCMNRITNNSWSKIKSEWFEMKSANKHYCPDHIPDWVAAWRKKKLKEKDG